MLQLGSEFVSSATPSSVTSLRTSVRDHNGVRCFKEDRLVTFVRVRISRLPVPLIGPVVKYHSPPF